MKFHIFCQLLNVDKFFKQAFNLIKKVQEIAVNNFYLIWILATINAINRVLKRIQKVYNNFM
jgi:hypothetical protein